MNDLVVRIDGISNEPKDMQLVTLTRRHKNETDHPCHLFAHTGEKAAWDDLMDAVTEYLALDSDGDETDDDEDADPDWGDAMEDAAFCEILATHGLTEISIPMGMIAFVVGDFDKIGDY